jgi:hypothetical protein
MPNKQRTLRALLRKYCWFSALAVAAAPSLLLAGNASLAGEGKKDNGPLSLLKTIPVPVAATNLTGGLYSWDISWVDQATQTYYLADRSNNVVDVVNAQTASFVGQIPGGFAGIAVIAGVATTAQSGPNGVVTGGHCLFVTDSPSRVVSFDLNAPFPPPVASTASTGGADNFRADELAYAPGPGLILAINNADTPPFGTLISVNKTTCALTVGKRITFGAATNGAEQPVWNPGDGRFYLSIPSISGTLATPGPTGAVYRINPNTASFETAAVVDDCGPAGLTLGPNGDLLVGCNLTYDVNGNVWDFTKNVTAAPRNPILHTKTGILDETVFGAGAGDEVWFNWGDGKYYVTGSGSPYRPLPASAQGSTPLGVIDADEETLDQLVPTFNVPAVGTGNSATQHPAGTAHSVAANGKNNFVFVPLGANNAFPDCLTGCIAVYGRSE